MPSIFTSLSADSISKHIGKATRRVIYIAPGIWDKAASALAELKVSMPDLLIEVSLDFNEHTLRMGYGSLKAVQVLKDTGITVNHSPGFRSAILIIDNHGWVYTPTARYLEPEPQSLETPNAIHLTEQQINEIAIRVSPHAKKTAIKSASSPEEKERLESILMETGETPVSDHQYSQVCEEIEIAPPVGFDITRQVRVFEPYLQYVELTLTGAAIQRHRVRIPNSLQNLIGAEELEGRLHTTFDLIEKSDALSSKPLEEQLNQIRKDLTPSLGKNHGRVVLKSAKPLLIKRLNELESNLEEHRTKVKAALDAKLEESCKQVVEYYFPLAKENPPDALVGGLLKVDDEAIRSWLETELEASFPNADELISGMDLEDRYKDVTFETLNQPDFLESVQQAFPRINWDRAYNEFKAAGENSTAEGAAQ